MTAHALVRRYCKDGVRVFGAAISRYSRNDSKKREEDAHFDPDPDADIDSDVLPEDPPSVKNIVDGALKCTCHGDVRVRGPLGAGPGLYQRLTCSKRTALVRRCAGCHFAWYCDKECQRED
ncbi:hypothetical protein C8Q80DRAFT_1173338 [Daedaleopsis nitida]|nr:hypothetical protein C8Q80DRAFT_1173338 [Daedaleopsis nitida]